jgi:hypothetical protein
MVAEDPLEYEARVRPRQALVAGSAAFLLLLAAVFQIVGPQPKVNELTVQLIATDKRAGLELVGAVIDALGLFAVAGTLSFLFTAARARRPEMQPFLRWTGIAGGVLAGIGGFAYAIVLTGKAHTFVTHGSQTYEQANSLLSTAIVGSLQFLGLLAALLLAIGLVMISLNAMRIGLLTRFMGYLGIIAGVASMFLIGSPPVVILEVFWLSALAYLFSGRWPSGVPASWSTGRVERWPTSAEMREQRAKSAGSDGRGKTKQAPAPEPVAASAPGRTRSSTPKRKRKRRR